MKDAFAVATKGVIVQDGRVLILRRCETAHYRCGTWECPGGKLEFKESPKEGLVREIREETGLFAQVHDILYVSDFFTNPERHVILLTYGCTAERAEVALSDEHTAFEWATREMFERMVEADIVAEMQGANVFGRMGIR